MVFDHSPHSHWHRSEPCSQPQAGHYTGWELAAGASEDGTELPSASPTSGSLGNGGNGAPVKSKALLV